MLMQCAVVLCRACDGPFEDNCTRELAKGRRTVVGPRCALGPIFQEEAVVAVGRSVL
jgi:hypothetical protein